MSGKQINPKLIHALTNQPLTNIPTSPTFKHLGGIYVKSIVDQLKKIETPQPKNEMMMKCGKCGHSGKYDIGIVAISVSVNGKKQSQQLTGYFRCKHCNAGGPWKDSPELLMFTMSALMAPQRNLPVHFGEIQLSDGYEPPYATDGEEHYLKLIAATPMNGLLWNKLGNLYLTGSRPELAMAAFEKSIEVDPNQVESHLSIANLLMQLRNYKQAIHHLHQMMIAAEAYPHLEATRLRELLAHGICTSFIAATESKNKYEALPTQTKLIEAGSTANLQSDKLPRYLTLSSEDISTFYPLAEAFMGARVRKLDRKSKKKKTQQKRTKSQQVEAFIYEQQGFFKKGDIQQACPDISLATITKVIRELRKAGVIEMTGTGTDIQWYKK
ncbi:tetratricopeptide repeat protein [Lysinibacillus sp. 54212]|uniref:tetratricopeptide repeat protein n=1 Tax=Lysinibacillus sp. 54212 TaxID=3119829 RepID=UPI002FC5B7CF